MARLKDIDIAIVATQEEDYLRAYNLFLEVYGTEDAPPLDTAKAANGLSFFGVCVALIARKYKTAIDLCKRAIEIEFYNGDHFANLARVYVAAGNRKKAIEAVENGLKVAPDNDLLMEVRNRDLGVRSRPSVPFLDRSHPINVTLGQARHAKKLTEDQTKTRKKK